MQSANASVFCFDKSVQFANGSQGLTMLFHIISARVSNLFSSSNYRILSAPRNQRVSLAFRVHMSRNHDNYQCKDSEMLVAGRRMTPRVTRSAGKCTFAKAEDQQSSGVPGQMILTQS